MGSVGPRLALCWPLEPCYQGPSPLQLTSGSDRTAIHRFWGDKFLSHFYTSTFTSNRKSRWIWDVDSLIHRERHILGDHRKPSFIWTLQKTEIYFIPFSSVCPPVTDYRLNSTSTMLFCCCIGLQQEMWHILFLHLFYLCNKETPVV